MSSPIGPIALAVLAAAIGALFASADAALTSLPEARLQVLVEDENEEGFARYAADRLRLLSRWLVIRVIALTLAAVVLKHMFSTWLGPIAAAFAAVFVSVMVYATFAEALGTIARRRPEEVGRMALKWLQPLEYAVVPIAEPLAMLGRWVGSRVPESSTSSDARLTETEVEWLIAKGEKAGALEKEPATMIRNVLDFKHLTAKEVMVPRRRVSGIELSTPLDKVLDHVTKDGHSRYPVYRETLDNTVGLLYVKDLFDVVRAGKMASMQLEELLRKPVVFVAESQGALSVLREMRGRRLHLAIVSDEFGGTSGIVTLEDIIEEVFGPIYDEHDPTAEAIRKQPDGSVLVDGVVTMSDLENELGTDFPDDEEADYETVAGLLMQEAGRVPERGFVCEYHGYRFEVLAADATHVRQVEVRPIPAAAEPPVAAAG